MHLARSPRGDLGRLSPIYAARGPWKVALPLSVASGVRKPCSGTSVSCAEPGPTTGRRTTSAKSSRKAEGSGAEHNITRRCEVVSLSGRFRKFVHVLSPTAPFSVTNAFASRAHQQAPLSQGDHEILSCQLKPNRRVDRASLSQDAAQSTRHPVPEFSHSLVSKLCGDM
jgi:hypothetical protein